MMWQIANWIAGSILALAWLSRIIEAAIGMPSIADVARPEWDRKPPTAGGEPRVSVIVPARNEEHDIRATLESLLALDYSNYEIIAVNDRSTDATGQRMDEVRAGASDSGRLQVIHVSDLPPGWMGKTHAMWTAAAKATGEWLLFTDGDVVFKPDSVRRVIAYAETEKADHVVLFPRMIMEHPGERMMISFFQALFVFGHRPWKVADPKTKDHMGVGAFNMVRRPVYDAVGTYRALRMEVLDDMKLGKVVKNAGFRQRNVFGEDLISLRWVKGTFGIVDNLTKNFFALMSFQWPQNRGIDRRPGLAESGPVCRIVLGAWMGAVTVCCRAGIALCDLLRHGANHERVAALLPAAPGQYDAGDVHIGAIDDIDDSPKRDHLARD